MKTDYLRVEGTRQAVTEVPCPRPRAGRRGRLHLTLCTELRIELRTDDGDCADEKIQFGNCRSTFGLRRAPESFRSFRVGTGGTRGIISKKLNPRLIFWRD